MKFNPINILFSLAFLSISFADWLLTIVFQLQYNPYSGLVLGTPDWLLIIVFQLSSIFRPGTWNLLNEMQVL